MVCITPVCLLFQERYRQREKHYFKPSGQRPRSLHDFFLFLATGAAILFVVVLHVESAHGKIRRFFSCFDRMFLALGLIN